MKKKVFFFLGFVLFVILVILVRVFFWPKKDFHQEFARLLTSAGIDKPNLLLITLDTTRADHLPTYGYLDVKTPHLDELAEKGIVFDECIASSPLTLPSHCSMMTGLYPTFHGVRVNGNTALSDQHLTLAELFSQAGYTCGAFIGAFVLDGRWGLRQGFHHYDDQFDLKKYKQLDLGLVQRPGNEVVDATLAWLSGQKDKKFFAWVHLYDPHIPYEPPEPYFSEYGHRGLVGLYDGEIAFMDEQIGRLVHWLNENGLDRNTMIVLIGDHGEGLGDHGEMAHGYFIYDYAVKVPFLIATPAGDFKGKRVKAQVRTVDLFPTLLEVTGLTVPPENQGKSVLPFFFKPETNQGFTAYSESYSPEIHYGWSPLVSLRTNQFKFIDAPRPELYALAEDPGELQNVHGRNPGVARDMKKALEAIIHETSLNAPAPASANLDRETIERLAALGYVGAPVSRKSSRGKDAALIDPKDKLHIYESIQQAGALLNQEKYEEASRMLEAVVREEKGIPQAHLLLATCYVELKRAEEAKTQYDLILRDDANSIQALIGMANVLREEGNKEDVITLCKKALSLDERNVQAYNLIGEVYMEDKDHAGALPYLEKAVEIQPKLTQNSLNLGACLVGLKRYEEAEVRLKEIAAHYPKFPLVHFHLGLLYEEQGRIEEAMKAYREEFGLYSDHFRARFNHGRLLLKLGDRAGYLNEMKEVIRTAPQAAEGYLFLARGLLLEGADLNTIQELVEKGLTLAKTAELNTLGYFLLADVYTRRQQPARAREALEKANSYKNLTKSVN
ncbi:MAG: sulfatase-like hydrolase/transferase [Clostridiales bacterium]|nr:sulfatase-like hydrolase/transferase [Clostridiales bacterium]